MPKPLKKAKAFKLRSFGSQISISDIMTKGARYYYIFGCIITIIICIIIISISAYFMHYNNTTYKYIYGTVVTEPICETLYNKDERGNTTSNTYLCKYIDVQVTESDLEGIKFDSKNECIENSTVMCFDTTNNIYRHLDSNENVRIVKGYKVLLSISRSNGNEVYITNNIVQNLPNIFFGMFMGILLLTICSLLLSYFYPPFASFMGLLSGASAVAGSFGR